MLSHVSYKMKNPVSWEIFINSVQQMQVRANLRHLRSLDKWDVVEFNSGVTGSVNYFFLVLFAVILVRVWTVFELSQFPLSLIL